MLPNHINTSKLVNIVYNIFLNFNLYRFVHFFGQETYSVTLFTSSTENRQKEMYFFMLQMLIWP